MERHVTVMADIRKDVTSPEELIHLLQELSDLPEELGIAAPSLVLWENNSCQGGDPEQAVRFLKGDEWWFWRGEPPSI